MRENGDDLFQTGGPTSMVSALLAPSSGKPRKLCDLSVLPAWQAGKLCSLKAPTLPRTTSLAQALSVCSLGFEILTGQAHVTAKGPSIPSYPSVRSTKDDSFLDRSMPVGGLFEPGTNRGGGKGWRLVIWSCRLFQGYILGSSRTRLEGPPCHKNIAAWWGA